MGLILYRIDFLWQKEESLIKILTQLFTDAIPHENNSTLILRGLLLCD